MMKDISSALLIHALKKYNRRGARLITITPSPPFIIYHLDLKNEVISLKVKLGPGLRAKRILSIYRNSELYEREAQEFFQIDFGEKLSPLFTKESPIPKSGTKINLGPYHPLMKEPEHVTLFMEGEEIVDVDFSVGYMHRSIENSLTKRPYDKGLYLAERICGICSSAHSVCFTQLVEKVMGVEIPKRAAFIRSIISELERMHSHLLWLGLIFHTLGFETLFMNSMSIREYTLDVLDKITGKRINYSICRYGGVRHDVTPTAADLLRKNIRSLRENIKTLEREMESNPVLYDRLHRVGVLSRDKAREIGVVGPLARASGIRKDIRRDDPYSAYKELDFNIITHKKGDSLARTYVRVKELYESLDMLEQLLDLPSGPLHVPTPSYPEDREESSRVEAPRGENFHYIHTGPKNPKRVRVRPPTFANFIAIPNLLRGAELADAPVSILSIDPCFACMDRCLIVDLEKNTSETRKFKDIVKENLRK